MSDVLDPASTELGLEGASMAPAASVAPPGADGGSASKENSKSRESKSKKDAASKDVEEKIVGSSRYYKKRVKEEKEGKVKSKTFWILDGKTMDDREFVWREVTSKDGSTKHQTYYFSLACPDDRKWELPDVSNGDDAEDPMERAIVAVEVQLEKKKFKERKEWKDDATKKPVLTATKRALTSLISDSQISKENSNTIIGNVSKEYMSTAKKLDAEGEKWITAKVHEEVGHYLAQKRKNDDEYNAKLKALEAHLAKQALDPNFIPKKPRKHPIPPSSPFLPQAHYVRDPYYYKRVHHRNPARTTLETTIEKNIFFHPNSGEVKVLYALQTALTSVVQLPTAPPVEGAIIAIVRDWACGYAVALLNPGFDIVYTLPMLKFVEFDRDQRTFNIDNIPVFAIDFPANASGDDLEHCARLAHCAMFGDGSNDETIVVSRARSVEMASALRDMCRADNPAAVAPSAAFLQSVIKRATTAAAMDSAQRFELRQKYLRVTAVRDHLLQDWIQCAQSCRFNTVNRDNILSLLLDVLEESILHILQSNDPQLVSNIVAALNTMRTDLPEPMKRRVDVCRAWVRFTEMCVNERYIPRDDCETAPFETMFQPVEHTVAHREEEQMRLDRKRYFAASQLPSGIYLSIVIHSGNEILVHRNTGNLPGEVIVQHPTADELRDFGDVDRNADFKWLLTLAGGNPNWADFVLSRWTTIYDNIGTRRFRGMLVRALRRLREKTQLTSLGIMFDRPIVLPNVQCGHLLCVLSTTKAGIFSNTTLSSEYEWKNRADLEFQTYIRAFSISANARLNYLSTNYNKCERWILASIEHQATVLRNPDVNNRLPGGFFLGFVGCQYTSDGYRVIVPERNRTTLPLALISHEFPSLEEWRWIQSLNEHKKRVNSFGFDSISKTITPHSSEKDCITFKHKFLRAVLEVQAAVGVEIDVFFDYEIITLDENKRVKAVFATCRQLTPTTEKKGEEPMAWMDSTIVESQHFWAYWPTVYPPFLEAREHEFIRAYSTCQPFTTDEVQRHNNDSCALYFYLHVDKLWSCARWLPTLIRWCMDGCTPLVAKWDADRDHADPTVKTVEEAVEVAVSNYSSSLDLNVLTMRSLLMDAAASIATGADDGSAAATLFAKLREVDRVMRTGYAQRICHVPPAKPGSTSRPRRTYDELQTDEESDDETGREATVYELDCTLEELIFFNPLSTTQATSVMKGVDYFNMQEIVDHIVDLACVECVDVGDVKQVGQCISNMISVIETMEDLKEDACLLEGKLRLRDDVLNERDQFQHQWFQLYKDEEDLAQQTNSADAAITADEDEERAANELTAMYYDGSSYAITSVEQGVRTCILRAMGSLHQMESLMSIASSTQEALEVEECIVGLSNATKKHNTLVAEATGGNNGNTSLSTSSPTANGQSQSLRRGPANLVLVSQEYHEFPVHNDVDPNRCLVLKGVTGKIRFPSVEGKVMAVFAQFFNIQDSEISSFLKEIRSITDVPLDVLLSVALQLKTPLIVLRLCQMLYGSPAGPSYEGKCDYYFTAGASVELRNLLGDSFLFQYGLRDWVHWNSTACAGRILNSAMDVLWWIRFTRESAQSQRTQGAEMKYADHECSWLGVYCETRVKVFLTFGVHTLSRDELQLWRDVLGRHVEYLSVRDTGVGDAEVEVLSVSCPGLTSVDLANTAVTDRGVRLLVDNCRSLVDVSVDGCHVSAEAVSRLQAVCEQNRQSHQHQQKK